MVNFYHFYGVGSVSYIVITDWVRVVEGFTPTSEQMFVRIAVIWSVCSGCSLSIKKSYVSVYCNNYITFLVPKLKGLLIKIYFVNCAASYI